MVAWRYDIERQAGMSYHTRAQIGPMMVKYTLSSSLLGTAAFLNIGNENSKA